MNGLAAKPRPAHPSARSPHSSSSPRQVRRKSEIRLGDHDLLDILLEQGMQAVGIVCPERGAIKLSANWQQMTGVEPAAHEGAAFFDLLHPQHAEKFKRRLGEFLHKGGAKPALLKCQVMHADGGWRWLEFTLTRACDNAVICLARNITDETKDRQQLQKTMLEAELALKARSEFLAHLSHELRTPLNAILGFTQMIEHKVYGELGDERYNAYLANIKESGHTLLGKLGDLFEIAYIDAGYTTLSEEPLDIADLFAQAVEIVSHHAFTQQVRIHVQTPATPIHFRGDRLKLLKVLLCLASNAIKFNRSEGEVTLTAEIHRIKGLVISVSDTGQGIADRQLAHINTVLNHEESFLARDRDHAGTGLALAGELVRMHGGTIEVETELGEGSHFAVCLPRQRILRGVKKDIKPSSAQPEEAVVIPFVAPPAAVSAPIPKPEPAPDTSAAEELSHGDLVLASTD